MARGAQQGPTGLIAWIEVAQTGRVTEFRAMAAGGAPGAAEFALTAEVEGSGGRNRSRQGGTVHLDGSGAPKTLSRLGLGIGAGATVRVSVTVRGSDGTTSRAELVSTQGQTTDL
ncbi:MAG: curli-like amyloid fiber formation chaperone CsgH [Pseudomonadota bacterium]